MFDPPATSETSYIIKQNESLHIENRELRNKVHDAQDVHGKELRALQAKHDTLENENDALDESMRYLRNLQKTLVALHVEAKELADGYRDCDVSTEVARLRHKKTTEQYKIGCVMILVAYALTYATALCATLTSSVMMFATTTIGVVSAWEYLVMRPERATTSDLTRVLTESEVTNRRVALIEKTKEYQNAVDGLPGIEELIETA